MQINFAGRSHESGFAHHGTPNQLAQPRTEHQHAEAMEIDSADAFVPMQQRPQISAQDRAIKRIREQRKLDNQINSRQVLLDKAEMAKKLIEQKNKREISDADFIQAMAELRALKIRY